MPQPVAPRIGKTQNWLMLSLIPLLLSVIIAISLTSGVYDFSLAQALSILVHADTSKASLVLWELRLPRTLVALTGGAALAISGWLMQAVVRNPLASPNLTGVMSGAALAVMISELMAWPAPTLVLGILGGILGGFTTISISWKQGVTPARLALAGIAVSAFCQACVTLVLLTDRVDSESLFFWLTGSIAGANWEVFTPLFSATVLIVILLALTNKQRLYLQLDDQVARGIGVNLNQYRLVFGVLAVVLTAACVGAFGPVGFIGLVAPHLARLTRTGLLGAAIIGAALLTLADLLARTLLMPLEIPIGVLTALMGAPWFLYLIIQRARVSG
ncbi:FecCD family ABC transporter permease [Photobacterium sp. BZF1]|uniref:FecCD family ABC transporter permease n=1 Tax=Photobacterium sp. BZF1 TaxID=1904457 RepID=UPI00351C04E8